MNCFQFRSKNKLKCLFKKQLIEETCEIVTIAIMATKLTTVKRQSYTVSDKLRIIQFAEQHGNRRKSWNWSGLECRVYCALNKSE